jgi:hypothetical protein
LKASGLKPGHVSGVKVRGPEGAAEITAKAANPRLFTCGEMVGGLFHCN